MRALSAAAPKTCRSMVTAETLDAGTVAVTTRPRAGVVALRLTWTALAVVLASATTAVTATIGPDSRWLAALGRIVGEEGRIPHGIPFAAAVSASWPNVPVLAEVAFGGLFTAFGARGLLVAQLLAVAVAMAILGRDMRREGATDAGAATVLALLLPGALLAFAGVKAQLFSIALFPAAAVLLRAETRRPSRRIWLVVPLLALWSNLHGVALLGLAVLLAYLLLERARRAPMESAAVAVASALALCATPALEQTPRYYADVMTSEAAARGYGLWAPLSLHAGFDVLLVAVALPLLAAFVRARPRVWEFAVAAALAGLTIHAARDGVWLLLFVAPPAAQALRLRSSAPRAIAHGIAFVLVAVGGLALVRGPMTAGASERLVHQAIAAAQGGPILAEPATAERIALAGGRVVISNPLDAFSRTDQRAYIDWLQARRSADPLLRRTRVVVVSARSPADRRLRRDGSFRAYAESAGFRIYLRTRLAP